MGLWHGWQSSTTTRITADPVLRSGRSPRINRVALLHRIAVLSAVRGDLGGLLDALQADVEGVAVALLGPANRGGSRHQMRWGTKGSLSLELRGPRRGVWCTHEGHKGGRTLALIRHVLECDLGDAIAWARRHTGVEADEADAPADRARRAQQEADRKARQATDAARHDVAEARERASKIGYAQSLAAASVPAVGTPADEYLTLHRGIPRPAAGWPASIRWDARHHALLGVATTSDGVVQRVQRTHLGDNGGKAGADELARRQIDAARMTNGPGENAVVRLPGDPTGPLQLAEGLETGISAWVSTRYETWIALGPIPRITPPEGRRVVVLSDDNPPTSDPQHGQAERTLSAGASSWRAADLDIVMATPWPQRRHDGSDFNDLLKADGSAAVAIRIELALLEPRRDRRTDTPPPGARRLVGVPGHTHTRLPPYHPFVTEPRAVALARQDAEIRGTVALGARIGAARREVERRRRAELEAMPEATPAQRGAVTRRLIAEVAGAAGFGRRLPPPPRVLMTGAMGTGKTRAGLSAIAAIRAPLSVWVTEPLTAKSEENLVDYRRVATEGSLPAIVVRGRSALDPTRPGMRMCRRAEVAERMARAGISVRRALCPACPVRDACGYLEQSAEIERMGGVGVFLLSAAHLFVKSPAPPPDLLVADERVDPVDVRTVPLTALHMGLFPLGVCGDMGTVTAAAQRLAIVRECLTQPQPLAALTRALVTRQMIAGLVRLLEIVVEPDASRLSGDLPDEAIAAGLDAIEADARAGQTLTLLRAVLREFDMPRLTLTGVAYHPGPATFTVSRLRELRGIRHATVMALDGTGDIELSRHLFGATMRHVEVRVERDAYVTGTEGRSYSTRSVTGKSPQGETLPFLAETSQRLQGEVATIIDRMPGPCLTVSSMASESELRAVLPDDAPTAHFGATRGRNTWEDCRSAVLVGVLPLTLDVLEAQARAYMATDPAPFVSAADVPDEPKYKYANQGWRYWVTRLRRMRDGSLSRVEVACHPDPRVDRVLQQMRDADVLQSGDRIRPIFNRRELTFLNDLALDVTYDQVLSHNDAVAGGTRVDHAYADVGILPLGGRDLYRAWQGPGRFTSEGAATKALISQGLSAPQPHRIVTVRPDRLYPVLFRYRRRGQRGSLSRVLIDTERHPDPRTALERLLGQLVLFEPVAPDLPVAEAVPEALDALDRTVSGTEVEPCPAPVPTLPAASTECEADIRRPADDADVADIGPPPHGDDAAKSCSDGHGPMFFPGPWIPIPWRGAPWPEVRRDPVPDPRGVNANHPHSGRAAWAYTKPPPPWQALD